MTKYLWVLVALWSSVSALASSRDIFTNTNQTRRVATASEGALAIMVGKGCSGFLLGPNTGMSAAHCTAAGKEITSSVALMGGKPADGKITKTLEIGSPSTFDVWIFEIEWDQKPYPKGIKIVPQVQVRKEQIKIGDNNRADAIYTLGFPGDISNGKLVLSWGYGKSDGNDGRVLNNISLINGNSGGAILRLKDKMLMSLVSGGPHRLGQPGWKDNDWNDKTHWNWGPAVWKWYQSSRSLQFLYPRGVSRYFNEKWDFEMLPGIGFQEIEEDLAAGF